MPHRRDDDDDKDDVIVIEALVNDADDADDADDEDAMALACESESQWKANSDCVENAASEQTEHRY